MSALRVAVVGLGWVGTHRHLPWLKRRSDVDVVGVIDHTPARVERAKSLFRMTEGAVAEGPHAVHWLDRVDAVTIDNVATRRKTQDVLEQESMWTREQSTEGRCGNRTLSGEPRHRLCQAGWTEQTI